MSRNSSRDKILIKTSWISTIGNAILSLAKIVVGIISGSLAVIIDGIDDVVMIFTARIMSNPTQKYVFGYEG